MYFSDSYELRQLEKLMRSIPNFRPRGHGVVILRRYEYTEKDCDCRACPHHISRKKGCGTDKCPCINERITAGAATLKEAVAETMAAIKYPPFVKRLNQYLKESEENPMYFKNEKHRTTFTEAVAKLDNLAVFVRSLIGLSQEAVNEKFGEYLNGNVLNAQQQEFIRAIINYVRENGDISREDLIEKSPFDNYDILTLFGDNITSVLTIVGILHDSVNVAA